MASSQLDDETPDRQKQKRHDAEECDVEPRYRRVIRPRNLLNRDRIRVHREHRKTPAIVVDDVPPRIFDCRNSVLRFGLQVPGIEFEIPRKSPAGVLVPIDPWLT